MPVSDIIPKIVKVKKNVKEYTKITNNCMECGVDMGDSNSRQLCGKTHCKS
jgi:ribosomal protein S27AE